MGDDLDLIRGIIRPHFECQNTQNMSIILPTSKRSTYHHSLTVTHLELW